MIFIIKIVIFWSRSEGDYSDEEKMSIKRTKLGIHLQKGNVLNYIPCHEIPRIYNRLEEEIKYYNVIFFFFINTLFF